MIGKVCVVGDVGEAVEESDEVGVVVEGTSPREWAHADFEQRVDVSHWTQLP